MRKPHNRHHDQEHAKRGVISSIPPLDDLTVAYQPILSGATIAIILFVIYELVSRLIFPNPVHDPVMFPTNLATLAILAGMFKVLQRKLSGRHLEWVGATVCLMLFVNAHAQQFLAFEQENLVYTILLMPIFATLLPRRRTVIFMVLISSGTLIYLVHKNLPEMMSDYLSVTFAGVMAALAGTAIVRNAVLNAVKARIEAIHDRETAERLADCDALTGLANRRSFFLELEARLDRLRDRGEPFILAVVDLDGFKPVNDTYGHAAGDQMLTIVANRLSGIAGQQATPARLGGDEFALIVPGPSVCTETALKLGHRIEAQLARPYELGEYRCDASGSVGLLICDDPNLSSQDLMERADHALYFAKRALQGKAVLFNAALELEMTASNQLDKALRLCDHEAEFTVKFQPQYDIVKSRITGYEALARWDSPELGSVSPELFIPAAERAGLIRPLTQILLSKALREMASWPTDLTLSFNLSAHDLMSPQAMNSVLESVKASGLPASRIEFEITETTMMSDFSQARSAINQITAAGHSVSLDDFGVGYSSLQYLQQLPVSKLKVDRSFVSQMLEDSSSYKIVRTLLALSQSLDLGCIVEGVETEAQIHILRMLGARHIQGYLVGEPIAADRIKLDHAKPVTLHEQPNTPYPPRRRQAEA